MSKRYIDALRTGLVRMIDERTRDRDRLAARVAELEAALDIAERLAAYLVEPVEPEGLGRIAALADTMAWDNEWWQEHLAAVRAVTRAATNADAPQKQGEGE